MRSRIKSYSGITEIYYLWQMSVVQSDTILAGYILTYPSFVWSQ